jgi:hypothetical protein
MNIKDLENTMYNVFSTLRKNTYEIEFSDFKYENGRSDVKFISDTSYEKGKFTLPEWSKCGDMKSLVVKRDKEIYTSLKEIIQSDWIKRIQELGENNLKKSNLNERTVIDIKLFRDKGIAKYSNDTFDIDIDNSIAGRILSTIIRIGSWIATNGRIGPGNYIIMNKYTYDYLDFYLQKIFPTDGVITKISSMDLILDENVTDDVIVMGRKNEVDRKMFTGSSVIIWTDQNDDILYREIDNDNVELNYNIIDVGLLPETQYFSIHLVRE